MPETASIGTEPSPNCPTCGGPGAALYEGLQDRVFGAPLDWTLLRCSEPSCRLLWLSPRPLPSEIEKAYKSYYTHVGASTPGQRSWKSIAHGIYQCVRGGYLRTRFGYEKAVGPSWYGLLAPLAFLHPAGIDAVSVDTMFLSAPKIGDRLLEIGCGNGLTLERMRARGWDAEGNEFDPQCVQTVQARGLTCHAGDLRDVKLPEQSFNAIYMGHVIEHVYDPRSFLRECFRLLRPNGRLVILTPNSESWGHRHYHNDWRGLEPPRHIQIFNSTNLLNLCRETGFVRCKIRTTNRGAWYILGTSRKIRAARLSQNAPRIVEESSLLTTTGLLHEAWGRFLRVIRPGFGEELLLIACKS